MMRILMVLRFSCALLCVLPWVAQGITLGDGDRTGVTVAQNAMNQVKVTNDRIQTIRGIPTEVEVTLDPVLGDAYLTVHHDKPFTAFITTEKKRRVVLDCLPLLDIPAKVIVIEPRLVAALLVKKEVQKNDVLALMNDLRRDVKALSATQKTFVAHESPKRQRERRVMLFEKHQGALFGRVSWVASFNDVQKEANDKRLAEVVVPVLKKSRHGFYVYEVLYV